MFFLSKMGRFTPEYFFGIGVALAIAELAIRVHSILTLKKFCHRNLLVQIYQACGLPRSINDFHWNFDIQLAVCSCYDDPGHHGVSLPHQTGGGIYEGITEIELLELSGMDEKDHPNALLSCAAFHERLYFGRCAVY